MVNCLLMKPTPTPQPQEIQAMFDRISPVYDSLNDWLSLGLHRVWKLMAVKWTDSKPDSIALDLCCGSGDLTFLLRQQVNQGKVIGIDFSPQLLTLARHKAQQKGYEDIEWMEGNVLSLPFADNSFDCITMGYGLRNVQDIPTCLKEIKRVLKPNGKASILDFHQPSSDWVANLQKFYLDYVVLTIADWYGKKDDYAYIYPSLQRFLRGDQQIKLAQETGFSQQIHYPLLGGMMGVLVLTK